MGLVSDEDGLELAYDVRVAFGFTGSNISSVPMDTCSTCEQ
jgi:hypothetical protein